VRTGFLVEEFDEVSLGAAAFVQDSGLGARGEELDGWVGGDTMVLGCGFGVVGFGVDFGDKDRGFGGEGCGEGFPGWGKGFAVYVC
jgi:hypothetical protein